MCGRSLLPVENDLVLVHQSSAPRTGIGYGETYGTSHAASALEPAPVGGLEMDVLKRGYHGAYHHMSFKHLQRYVDELAGRLLR